MLNVNILPVYNIPPKKEISELPITKIGAGEKNILILVQINKEEVKWNKENEDLYKILTAIKLTENDFVLLKAKDCAELSISKIQKISKIDKLILFGVDTRQVFNGIQFPYLQVTPFLDFEVLNIPSLDVLMDEKNKMMKTQLWVILQKWFQLK